MILTAIAAVSRSGALGADNRMLWHLPEDFAYFKRTTMGHTMIMGRRTYESIGRALPGRRTIVLTRDPAWTADDADVARSPGEALELAAAAHDEVVFNAGGGQVYELLLDRTDVLLLTEVDIDVEGEAYFPRVEPGEWSQTWREHHEASADTPAFDWVRYERRR